MRKKKGPSRLATELVETAEGMHRIGLLDRAAYDKITVRNVGRRDSPKIAHITPAQIRATRASARMSQAVFARYLNLTVGYVSQLERGTKRPTGAALV
jgi:putative transcriptional regulator